MFFNLLHEPCSGAAYSDLLQLLIAILASEQVFLCFSPYIMLAFIRRNLPSLQDGIKQPLNSKNY
ncbi:hypothetical protein QQP08_014114 [Theobroma cacao]|nr:hypothetical protein QQP08_014114 [Theobroma cacao]